MQETKSYSYELYKTNDEYKIVKLFQKTFKKNLILQNGTGYSKKIQVEKIR